MDQPLSPVDIGGVGGDDGHQDHPLGQGLGVFQEMEQGDGRAHGRDGEEGAGPRGAHQFVSLNVL